MKAMTWPTCKLALLHLDAAKPERGHHAQVERQHHHGHGHRHGAHGADGLVHQVVVGRAKAQPLVLGAHEGLDHAHAGQVLLHDGVERVETLLHAGKEGKRLADDPDQHEQDGGQQHEKEQRQLRAGEDGHDQAAHHQQRRAHHDAQQHHDHILHLGHVVGQPRDQLAGLQFVEVAEGERLHLGEERVAQVGAKALRGQHGKDGAAHAADEPTVAAATISAARAQHERMSCWAMPSSMMRSISHGCIRSMATSSIITSGARMAHSQ